jgi:Flp pilus assembly protein TadG
MAVPFAIPDHEMSTTMTTYKRGSRRKNRTRGQALVEFALVIPVFLLVLCGILDFGLMLYSRMTVINASREGARISVTAADHTTIPSLATGMVLSNAFGLNTAALSTATSCVAIKTPGSCNWSTKTASQSGDAVSVTVTYTYQTFFPLFFGSTFPMSSTVQMVLE